VAEGDDVGDAYYRGLQAVVEEQRGLDEENENEENSEEEGQ